MYKSLKTDNLPEANFYEHLFEADGHMLKKVDSYLCQVNKRMCNAQSCNAHSVKSKTGDQLPSRAFSTPRLE